MIDKENRVSRPKSIKELTELMGKFWNEEGIEESLKFKPQADDIIISPFPKSGTTFLMQIAHMLRTRGSMEFDEIMNVIPWIEMSYDVDWDLEGEQVAKPRLYKSHMSWDRVPKGCRYIVSFRSYHSNVVSGYRFLEGWLFEPGTISIDEFVKWQFPRSEMADRGYWFHLASWWEQRDNDDVLLLCYEDMINDTAETIHKVADFMGIKLDEKLLDIVLQKSSRTFMLKHRDKFDQHQIVEYSQQLTNIPPPINADTVTPGAKNEPRYKLSEEMKQELDQIWEEQITDKYGVESYDELRKMVRNINSNTSQ